MASRIIAISGKSGCGNTTVSGLVSKALNIELINYTFRSLAKERGMAFEKVLEEAQKDFSYDRAVDERQVELAHLQDCVVGSRLALWLLKDATLKVYLWASPEVRAGRIHHREGSSMEEVIGFTALRDKHDHERYLELYGIDNDDFSGADLTINAESFSADKIAAIIVTAFREKAGI